MVKNDRKARHELAARRQKDALTGQERLFEACAGQGGRRPHPGNPAIRSMCGTRGSEAPSRESGYSKHVGDKGIAGEAVHTHKGILKMRNHRRTVKFQEAGRDPRMPPLPTPWQKAGVDPAAAYGRGSAEHAEHLRW